MSFLQSLRFGAGIHLQKGPMTYAPARLQMLQQSRLEKLLAYAKAHSPFYREKLKSIDPRGVTLADIPPTTKDQIRENYNSVPTDPRLKLADLQAFIADDKNLGTWFLGEYAVTQTSGSQGAPLMIVQHRRCIELIFALMAARSSPAKPTLMEGIKRAFVPRKVAAISFRRGFYPSGMLMEYMQEVIGSFVQVTRFKSAQPDLAEQLNQLQPNVITANASVLEALAMQPDRLQLRSLQYLTSSSEELSEPARNRIEAALRAPVFDHYGTGECLQLGDACPRCRKVHVNADWAILETVDERYQPVPAGQAGTKILVTNLANFAQPFIRYEIADCVALSPTLCGNGNPFPRIERIEGRAADLLCVPDGNATKFLSGIMFHTVFSAMKGVREWRVIQPVRNRLEILLQLLDPVAFPGDSVSAQLKGRLREFGLPEAVTVDVRFVPELTADPKTGKMRRIINEVGWPDAMNGSP